MNEFDVRAKAWDENPEHAVRAAKIAAAILKSPLFKPGASALEAGCGTGLLGFALRKSLGSLVLADASPGMLAEVERKIEEAAEDGAKTELLDLDSGASSSRRYGVIVSQMALHHVKDERKAFASFHAMLEDGGALFIADLDAEDGSFHGPEFDGRKGFDREALAEIARNAGFERISFQTVHEIVKESAGARRSYPVFLMEAAKAKRA